MSRQITIATRGSKLALWQAHHVRDRLIEAEPGLAVELEVIKTKGDKILDVPLAKVGGKGLFVKEIEQALIDGKADIAVHSMKDVPAELAPGLSMSAISTREDPRDALCARDGSKLADLPRGATVGTSSLRRMAQLKAQRPDLVIANLRGNVPTRLSKLGEGQFDAIVLAAAGLKRLGHADQISELLEPTICIPAVGQGTLGIETRADDRATADLARRAMHDEHDSRRTIAERSFLLALEGGCQTPMGAFATYKGDDLELRAFVGRPDGSEMLITTRSGPAADAEALGAAAAAELLERGAGAILAELIEAAAHG
jgi:hydroxymethylbilane synthase